MSKKIFQFFSLSQHVFQKYPTDELTFIFSGTHEKWRKLYYL